jgi:hypothetical protein
MLLTGIAGLPVASARHASLGELPRAQRGGGGTHLNQARRLVTDPKGPE